MKTGDRIVLSDIAGTVIAMDDETHAIEWDSGHIFVYYNFVDWSEEDDGDIQRASL
jgi:preprotein translocase subunit YajC